MSAALHAGQAALVAELQTLSTADRLVDASAVPETTPLRCPCCDSPAMVHVAVYEPCGLRTFLHEYDLCMKSARKVIEQARTDYVDVEVRIPVDVA